MAHLFPTLAQVRPSPAGKARKPGYRPELQGLRALAVLMVASYHVWFGRVSGGVDVFLLISAFLLSMSFLRKVESGQGLHLRHYWAHVFKRLLPAAAVVILGTLAATALFVPRSRWTEILSQAWSSLLYVQNWALAADSVDYYADHSMASPFQHFWSLSVQGQVFILWPLLFALSALIARTAQKRFRSVVLYVFGAVFAASLAFSVSETYTNQAHAYFDTRTRLWEFAFGTLLALALPYLKPGGAFRVAAGWCGLAAILSGGFILDVQGQFPGYVALWPLVAAALVIVAGQTGSRYGADRFLSWGPLVRMGDMSYALYLWHWPVLVIYLAWRDRQEVGPVGGALIIGLSLLLAYLTTQFVEKPLRSGKRAVAVIAVCAAVVAVPLGVLQYSLKAADERLLAEAEVNYPGARVLLPGYDGEPTGVPVRPASNADPESWGHLPLDCSKIPDGPSDPVLTGICFSTPNTTSAERTILIIGSSHAQQWVEAVEPMAETRNYRVIALLKGGCSFSDVTDVDTAECNRFNEAAIEYALDLKPDAVVAVATAAMPETAADPLVVGLPEAAERLGKAGIEVVGIRDNPRFTFDMQVCAEQKGADACTIPAADKLSPVFPPTDYAGDMAFLDFSDLICPEGTCRPVIGNTYVYLDNNHLTAGFTGSLATEFERRFHQVLGW
ncbi:acyltransferase family protein [Arthrobacter sp. zg-Y877]|uniref:acyltransferase family protein n=1 Tax=Arthrobacter sp. zg-Y877 TaxID=3049074 RepID=UPI0025A36D3C|nr:acyltransferase family protein [Arthrobacter sp. zg-Y877]MDM7989813.1 acyltransferase family protein [Arthrobacter sp. zg-Y877]